MKEKMKIREQVRDAFRDVKIGTVFTRAEIIKKVHAQYGGEKDSIIPTDYCYNRYNHGISLEKHLKLFEYTTRNTFRYLGEKYPYTGKIYHNPRNGKEICIGEYVNGHLQSNSVSEPILESPSIEKTTDVVHKTNRIPSLQLRFQILKRDNFKCCACGASPAKDPDVELHVDHIIPWSKGGETVLENLQTLCSRCNLGKRDSL